MEQAQPRGLYVLFMTEMGERFGFYLLLSIFTLFLTEYHHLSEGQASMVYGWYMFLVYLTPFFGGMLADRWIGYNRAISMGAGILGAGYAIFALKSPVFLVISMTLLVIGNGLFKPNISTLVGKLYRPGDPRRDSGFNIFYLGINLGALPSSPIGGYLRSHYGWGAAFSAAAVGMLISLVIFEAFRGWIELADQNPQDQTGQVVRIEDPEVPEDPILIRYKRVALFCLCVVVMFFWIAFHQNGTSLTYWARDNTDRVLRIGTWSTELSPESFQMFNSAFVLLLTGLMIKLWGRLNRWGAEPSTPMKIGIGMLLTGLAYVVMWVAATFFGGNQGLVHMGWLIGTYFVLTVAELCLSPMGLSLVTKLAPRKSGGVAMGIWFLATAMGNFLSGFSASFWNRISHSAFFGCMSGISVLAFLILLGCRRRIQIAIDGA